MNKDDEEMSGPESNPLEGLPSFEKQVIPSVKNMTVHSQEAVILWSAKPPQIYLFNPAKEKPHLVESPIIHVGEKCNAPTRWRIQLSDDFWYKNSTRTVAIYLWRLNDFDRYAGSIGPFNVRAHYQVQILDKEDNPVFTRENGIRDFKQGDCYGWKNFIPYSEVLPYIHKNTIRVKASVKILVVPSSYEMEDRDTIDIKWKDEIIMRAIKSVLIEKSPQFESLLSAKGSETTSIQVDVNHLFPNVDPNLIKEMLLFMHTDTCPLLEPSEEDKIEEKFQLFSLGVQFVVKDLSVSAITSICNRIRPETAAEIAIIAKNFNLKDRPDYAQPMFKLKQYFFENVDELKRTDNFKKASENKDDQDFFAELIFDYLLNPTFK